MKKKRQRGRDTDRYIRDRDIIIQKETERQIEPQRQRGRERDILRQEDTGRQNFNQRTTDMVPGLCSGCCVGKSQPENLFLVCLFVLFLNVLVNY